MVDGVLAVRFDRTDDMGLASRVKAMSIAEWREMPKYEGDDFSDEREALRDRLRDTAAALAAFVDIPFLDGTCESDDAKAILKRLKEEGLT